MRRPEEEHHLPDDEEEERENHVAYISDVALLLFFTVLGIVVFALLVQFFIGWDAVVIKICKVFGVY